VSIIACHYADAAPHRPVQTEVDALEVLPQNVAVLVGGTALLTCSVSPDLPTYRIQWWEYASMPNGNLISDNDYLTLHPERDRFVAELL